MSNSNMSERDVKEMKDGIQEVKKGNVVVKETLDEMQSDSNKKALVQLKQLQSN